MNQLLNMTSIFAGMDARKDAAIKAIATYPTNQVAKAAKWADRYAVATSIRHYEIMVQELEMMKVKF